MSVPILITLLTSEIGLRADAVERVRQVVLAIPERVEDVCAAARAEGIDHPIVDVLQKGVRRQAATCLAALDRPARE